MSLALTQKDNLTRRKYIQTCRLIDSLNYPNLTFHRQAQYLEQTNDQMKTALIKMYQLLDQNNLWTGTHVQKCADGSPRVHDILQGLGVINQPVSRRSLSVSSPDFEEFEERPHKRSRSHSYDGRRSINTSLPALDHVETP
jgi:hypothetical protein